MVTESGYLVASHCQVLFYIKLAGAVHANGDPPLQGDPLPLNLRKKKREAPYGMLTGIF